MGGRMIRVMIVDDSAIVRQVASEAIAAQPRAEFYRAVALFTQAFMNVEAQGFDLVE